MIIVLVIGLIVSYVANGRYVEGMKEGREGVDEEEDEEDEEDEETETVRYYKKNGKCLKVKKNKIKKFCTDNKCFKNSKCREYLSSQPMELNNLDDKQNSQVDYADTP